MVQIGAARDPPRLPRRARDAITTADMNDHWGAVAGAVFEPSGTTRKHYIQAEEVTWDYAPNGSNGITGAPFGDDENVFVRDFIGSKYTKCLYFEYTDDRFAERMERAAEDAYLGLLGPVLRAEVGDRIEVVYRNSCSFRNSVHAHGLFYEKGSEGAPHDDGTPAQQMADDMVEPGGGHTFRCAPRVRSAAQPLCPDQGSRMPAMTCLQDACGRAAAAAAARGGQWCMHAPASLYPDIITRAATRPRHGDLLAHTGRFAPEAERLRVFK